MYKVTNDFKEACEDNNVMYVCWLRVMRRIAGFSNAFSEQSVDASVGMWNGCDGQEDSQALYEQAAMEYAEDENPVLSPASAYLALVLLDLPFLTDYLHLGPDPMYDIVPRPENHYEEENDTCPEYKSEESPMGSFEYFFPAVQN